MLIFNWSSSPSQLEYLILFLIIIALILTFYMLYQCLKMLRQDTVQNDQGGMRTEEERMEDIFNEMKEKTKQVSIFKSFRSVRNENRNQKEYYLHEDDENSTQRREKVMRIFSVDQNQITPRKRVVKAKSMNLM